MRVRGKKLLMFTLGGEKLSMLGTVNYLTYQNYALGTDIFIKPFRKRVPVFIMFGKRILN